MVCNEEFLVNDNSKIRPVDARALEQYSHPSVRGTYGYSAKAEDWVVSVGDIRNAPTLDYEPVRYGYWIDITPVMSSGKAFKCNKCGRTVVLGMSRSNSDIVEEYPYCHCGCKMRREDENDTRAV